MLYVQVKATSKVKESSLYKQMLNLHDVRTTHFKIHSPRKTDYENFKIRMTSIINMIMKILKSE